MYNAGTMFNRGEGCQQDYAAAAGWYRQAAAGGVVEAKVNLGNLLCTGSGVARIDYAQANALYLEAIEGGNEVALYRMGCNYFQGHGVEENTATALSYWQRAADQGHAEAAVEVGVAYWKGHGGYEADIKLAKKYTRSSAALGDEDAIANLEEMTACAQCGTGSAPRVCDGCKQVHYCNTECQLLHWQNPTRPHRLHCSIRHGNGTGATEATPRPEKKKSDRPCAACGAHGAKMLCSDCLYGEVPLKLRYCGTACQLQHWSNSEDPHMPRCSGCEGLYDEETMTKKEFQIDRNECHADLKRASKPLAPAPAPAPARA